MVRQRRGDVVDQVARGHRFGGHYVGDDAFAEVVVGPRPPAPQAWVDVAGVSIACLPLADAAALVLAAGPDRPSVLTALAVNRSARQPGG